jgi:hypothetical protein
MHHQNASHRSSLHTPRHRFHLTLLPLATLYLSTALTADAQLNPNLMKYACGPANGVPGELARWGQEPHVRHALAHLPGDPTKVGQT